MSEAYILRAFRKFQDAGTVKMAQFFIINGITDPGLHHQNAQYAFLEGVESCDLYEYLHGAFHKERSLFFSACRSGWLSEPSGAADQHFVYALPTGGGSGMPGRSGRPAKERKIRMCIDEDAIFETGFSKNVYPVCRGKKMGRPDHAV